MSVPPSKLPYEVERWLTDYLRESYQQGKIKAPEFPREAQQQGDAYLARLREQIVAKLPEMIAEWQDGPPGVRYPAQGSGSATTEPITFDQRDADGSDGRIVEWLPDFAFTKYDVAEYDNWLVEYVLGIREQGRDKWWLNIEARCSRIRRRAAEVRELLVQGKAQLRPMPPEGVRLPSYATLLVPYLNHPGSADAGAGRDDHGTPDPPRSAPTVFCVPAAPKSVILRAPTGAPMAADHAEQHRPGRKRITPAEARQQFGEVFDLEREGLTDQEIARELRIDEKTVQRRRARFLRLHQRGEAATHP